MLLPVEFYEEVSAMQSEATAELGYTVTNAIQTNGTRLTPEWLSFLKRNKWGVGVSIDGPRELHDRHRVDVGRRGTFDRVALGMEKLAHERVPHGALMVLTAEMAEIGPDVIWNFVKDRQFRTLNLLPVRNTESAHAETIAPQSIDPNVWSKFVVGLFDHWWQDGRSVKIVFFDSVIRRIQSQAPETCVLAGRCFGAVYGIEPDGRVGYCPVLGGAEMYELGNILEASLREMRRTERFRGLVAANEARLLNMRQCPGFTVCAGGCPLGTLAADTRSGVMACCGFLPLIEHARNVLGCKPSAARLN